MNKQAANRLRFDEEPHPRLLLSRGAGPKGLRGESRRSGNGFPYEEKLSAARLTDEVDSVT